MTKRTKPAHGELRMYEKHGCRCAECTASKRDTMRDYNARAENPGKFCSIQCGNASRRGVDYRGPRFRPSPTLRGVVIERDSWTCQLCMEPIDPEAIHNSNGYATLDHITPRSLGGADNVSNLRAAHLWCNARRGNRDLEQNISTRR